MHNSVASGDDVCSALTSGKAGAAPGSTAPSDGLRDNRSRYALFSGPTR